MPAPLSTCIHPQVDGSTVKVNWSEVFPKGRGCEEVTYPTILLFCPPALFFSFSTTLLPSCYLAVLSPTLLQSCSPTLLPFFSPALLPYCNLALLPSYPPALLPTRSLALQPSYPPTISPSCPSSLLPSCFPGLLASSSPSLLLPIWSPGRIPDQVAPPGLSI